MEEKRVDKRKKKQTTIIFAVITVVVMLVLIVAFLQMNQMEPVPFSMMAILIGIPVLVIIGVIYACWESLKEIEGENGMKLASIDTIPGKNFEVLGLVKGAVVQSKNIGKDFMAGMKTLVGGEIVGYTEMLNEARAIAVKRMVDEAETMGADAVIGMRFGSSSMMQGAAEIIAYGTAVRFID